MSIHTDKLHAAARMFETGMPIARIAHMLYPEMPGLKGINYLEQQFGIPITLPSPPYKDPRAADYYHRIDLLRAGHSPERTEYNIPSMAPVYVPHRVPERSCTGSTMALVVAEGHKGGNSWS